MSLLTNSNFSRCGLETVSSGGALEIIDSSVSVQNLSFTYNTANTEGAMSIECTNYQNCHNQIHNNVFSMNSAIIKGVAISYDFRRPNFLDNSYIDNQALYGSNIASYAIRIAD